MKKFLAFVVILFFTQPGFANHLKGGWIQYAYLGAGTTANTSKYQVTVRQYLACNSIGGQRDAVVYLGIFDGATNQWITTLTIAKTGTDNPNKTDYSPCLNTKPPVCYIIDIYSTTVDLPNNAAGYILTVQRCCRIQGIINVGVNSNTIGISYTTKIPGIINGVNYSNNSSPVFAQKDTVIVCFNAPFTFDFSATDADGDLITYNFCDGLIGGDASQAGSQPNPPANPPYSPVPYGAGYSGSSPMGSLVTIDQQSGIISGKAPPDTGDYIVSVCANEFRNGVLISSTKKEIHIKVTNCSLSAATLKPSYITCNGTTVSFQNESTSNNITSYLWDFGVASLTTDTSTSSTPTYDYLKSGMDSGTYTVKLKVSSSGGCQDSTTAPVKIYPGFKTDFSVQGTCYFNAYQFFDATVSKYGTVNSWRWNFGDSTTLADTARSKDSAWTYTSARSVRVSLITTNSKGCIDTLTKPVIISDKPSLNLPFKDTLICSIDTLLLRVNIRNGATVLWTPMNGPNQTRIQKANTATPLVYPRDTTKYYVSVNDNGCANSDSVTVNVLQFISVNAGLDTGICRTDTIRLHPTSEALSYQWVSSTGENVAATKNPLVKPLVTTNYTVTANLGKCQATDSVLVKVAPYPNAFAGADVTICFGSRTQLNGNATGSVFYWRPANSLINENTLNPTAGPVRTTVYTLTATDTIGCPKTQTDTVVVTVIPTVVAYAGRDTTVVAGQPLQLQASGGNTYSWSPATGLNDPGIQNPIAVLNSSQDAITYTVRVGRNGCYSEDQVTVSIYKTGADIFVPSAFTPNGDGKNDIARPVTVGITKLVYFSIYNRWGQLLFTTTEMGKGWDGNYNGMSQPGGTYVYQALGADYLGNTQYRKGTIVLIR